MKRQLLLSALFVLGALAMGSRGTTVLSGLEASSDEQTVEGRVVSVNELGISGGNPKRPRSGFIVKIEFENPVTGQPEEFQSQTFRDDPYQDDIPEAGQKLDVFVDSAGTPRIGHPEGKLSGLRWVVIAAIMGLAGVANAVKAVAKGG